MGGPSGGNLVLKRHSEDGVFISSSLQHPRSIPEVAAPSPPQSGKVDKPLPEPRALPEPQLQHEPQPPPPVQRQNTATAAGNIISGVKNWVHDHVPIPIPGGATSTKASFLEPLPAALLGGRLIEAGRLLSAEANANRFFRDTKHESAKQAIDRIGRVFRLFTESEKELVALVDGSWDSESSSDRGPRIDFDVSNDILRIVSVSEHEDVDILRAFAALCEVDLLLDYTEYDDVNVKELHESPGETLLRVTKDLQKEENLLLASFVDALDEKQSMLWVSIQGLSSDADCLEGVPLPPSLSDGYKRTVSGDSLYALVRLRHASGSEQPAKNVFRLIAIHRSRLSQASKLYYSINPHGWMSRRYFTNKMKTFIEHFLSLVHSDALGNRMEESVRAPLYAQVRRHIDSKIKNRVP